MRKLEESEDLIEHRQQFRILFWTSIVMSNITTLCQTNSVAINRSFGGQPKSKYMNCGLQPIRRNHTKFPHCFNQPKQSFYFCTPAFQAVNRPKTLWQRTLGELGGHLHCFTPLLLPPALPLSCRNCSKVSGHKAAVQHLHVEGSPELGRRTCFPSVRDDFDGTKACTIITRNITIYVLEL